MYDYRVIFAVAGSVIGILAYVPYFRDIFRGTNKPHPFSWFVWGVLTAIVFVAQVVRDGGPGAWVSGITVVACFAIAALALRKGDRIINKLDWWSFVAALTGVGLWFITSEPLIAVIIVTVTDVIAYIPTLRKSYENPFEETLSTWVLNTIKWFLSIGSLSTISLTTALFPAVILPTNFLLIAVIVIRRRQLRRSA